MKNLHLIEYDETMERALDNSIKKWKNILYEKHMDNGSYDCPLCLRYKYRLEGTCSACPVMITSGQFCCENTPYEKWTKHHKRHIGNKTYVKCRWCSFLAWRELRMLKKLKKKLKRKFENE